jgi:hypothetical protein
VSPLYLYGFGFLFILVLLVVTWFVAKRQGAKQMGLDIQAQLERLNAQARGREAEAYKRVQEILQGKEDATIFGDAADPGAPFPGMRHKDKGSAG